MFEIFFFCLLMQSSFAFEQWSFREDYKYIQDPQGWFKFHKIPLNWHDARLRCKAEGAALISPSNSTYQSIMTSTMISENADLCRGIYSGVHSTFSVGTFTTIEGIPISGISATWIAGQPDNVYGERCVVFHLNGTLENVPCDDAYEFICYKKFERRNINKCNTVDEEYKWDARTSHCYKFHRLGKPWSKAHMTCAAEGGHLGVINSDQEAEIYKQLLGAHVADTIFGDVRDAIFLGFREWPDERSWFTIHGETLEEAGYAKWSGGQPDNYPLKNETQNCGAMFRSGLLDDAICISAYPFVCEKDPEASLS